MRIKIDQQNAPSDCRQRCCQVDTRGGLPYPTFLICYRNADHFFALTSVPTTIKLSASVTLGSTRNTPCHARRASASSRSAMRPLGSAQTVFLVDRCADISSRRGSGATARAVIMSNSPWTRSAFVHRTFVRNSNDSPTLWRKSARSRRGSTRVTGPSTRQAMTRPGSPAPDPISIQAEPGPGRSGRFEQNRGCDASHVLERRGRYRFCLPFSSRSNETYASSLAIVSRETLRPAARLIASITLQPGDRPPRNNADSAAGVTPGMREAWSSVSGRTASSRSIISFERPGTSAKSRALAIHTRKSRCTSSHSRCWRST